MPTLDPNIQSFLANAGNVFGDAPEKLGAQEWRRRMEEFSAAARAPRPAGVTVHDETLHANGREFIVRIYRPLGPAQQPALIYMHGGGWVLGSVNTHDGITAGIAKEANLTVISVNYSLSPEHPYPAALEDVQATTAWVIANASQLGVDPQRLMIGGDSAGGNMAAVLCQKYRDETGQIPYCFQLLVYPVTDTSMSQQAYQDHAFAPFLNLAEMQFFFATYCSDAAQLQHPYVAPLKAASLAGLPPALIMVAEFDPLRDEGGDYAKRLIDAKVNCEFRYANDLPHGFLRMRAWSLSAEREFQAMCLSLRRASFSGGR
ncbi:MAG: alpha/beta hydrolase [Anaerolineae bacterium]|nr:alpha/beta hydrolase [Anaerolineae bacterium]